MVAREVTMTELDRSGARVLRRIREGEVAVVSRHRRAVAMIVPLDDELDLVMLDPSLARGLPELAGTFRRRAVDRFWSAYVHGRPMRRGPLGRRPED